MKKNIILNFKENEDKEYILRTPHYRTERSLLEKDIATYTSGYGFKYGALMKLTEKGIEIRNNLLQFVEL